ncbi:phage tail terminator protein [Chromobacterium phragmitis]|uniref:Minor capsid protein n=1 Tax=Chromobacterium phragmitis TaxID=2202141 RepID=A0ABV0J2K4_9NEIS
MIYSSIDLLFRTIAERLEQRGVGKVGVDVFALHMPEDAVRGVLLRNNFNPSKIDYELPGYREAKVVAVCRGESYPDVYELADQVCRALHLENERLGRLHFNHLRPDTEPNAYPTQASGLYEALVTLSANYVIF